MKGPQTRDSSGERQDQAEEIEMMGLWNKDGAGRQSKALIKGISRTVIKGGAKAIIR